MRQLHLTFGLLELFFEWGTGLHRQGFPGAIWGRRASLTLGGPKIPLICDANPD